MKLIIRRTSDWWDNAPPPHPAATLVSSQVEDQGTPNEYTTNTYAVEVTTVEDLFTLLDTDPGECQHMVLGVQGAWSDKPGEKFIEIYDDYRE